jgi:predicted ribosome quality control (RQC) complex YloA/Tae2 family protein
MSLNWIEIDRILSELDLEDAHIERILQPSYDSIVLGLYKAGKTTDLLVSIAHGACRIHSLYNAPPKPDRPLRFQECLKSRIRGGRIESVRQLGTERVIRFDITVRRTEAESGDGKVYKVIGAFARDRAHGEASALAAARAASASAAPAAAAATAAAMAEPSTAEAAADPELRRYRLYARLWSGAGNCVLVDEDGLVVDSLARRPGRGEVSGNPCRIEEGLAAQAAEGKAGPRKELSARELPPLEDRPEGGNFNERIEAFYAAHAGELSRDKLLETARERFAKRKRALESRIAELEARAAEYRDADRFRELGDILMANQGTKPSGKLLECDDFFRGGSVAIEVDASKSVVDNARVYYERYRKANTGLADVEAELAASRASLEAEAAELARLESLDEPLLIARALQKGGTVRSGQDRKKPYPGLSLERNGWTILVGRSAKENDELLRHHVRGSDLWMHARDYAGSYVFVKARAGKSFPLDIMLDAGNLAIYYSKGRANGGGELYYTLAKHLRRAKDGPKGLVLPANEKNLHVNLEEDRLRELRALMGDDAG